MGLPLVAILIKALPERGGAQGSMDPLTGGYGVLLFLLGSVISWPQTQNSAMFSEVYIPFKPFVSQWLQCVMFPGVRHLV